MVFQGEAKSGIPVVHQGESRRGHVEVGGVSAVSMVS